MGGCAARVGAGGRNSSGLSKACVRVRACCDVATANAVSYLASEGEHISYNGLFLWSCRKCGIRGREGPGDAHNKLQGKCGRKDGAGATSRVLTVG